MAPKNETIKITRRLKDQQTKPFEGSSTVVSYLVADCEIRYSQLLRKVA